MPICFVNRIESPDLIFEVRRIVSLIVSPSIVPDTIKLVTPSVISV